ncbi:uncharacterized protein LOC143228276 [Tachypleus tridentatus]|uniref:uncharacterized protein LOC143228276 n=1 Tax=Tachypleus tridentatus TaxID=6853 RepID=UPI003FD5195B
MRCNRHVSAPPNGEPFVITLRYNNIRECTSSSQQQTNAIPDSVETTASELKIPECEIMFTSILVVMLAGRVWTSFNEKNMIKHNDAQRSMDQIKLDALLKFAVREIEKLKLNHHKLDECHGIEVASILRGRKEEKEVTHYYLTLKVQSTVVNIGDCRKISSSVLQPEVCEVEVSETVNKKNIQRSLVRSSCLQVKKLFKRK